MVNTDFKTWLIGSWVAIIVSVVAVSVAMSANISTTLLLLALGVTPGVVMAILGDGASSPTVAEILHNDARDARR
jgi:uncharacterized membrane protein YdjX (TVP38/TMEM64 family)